MAFHPSGMSLSAEFVQRRSCFGGSADLRYLSRRTCRLVRNLLAGFAVKEFDS